MSMKKIYRYALLAALPSLLFTACRFEDEDYFDEPAALRIEHSAQEVQNILVSAPQGWVMQYYLGTGVDQYEGFNLFARFENNDRVTLAGNHRMLRHGNKGKYTEATSIYEMLQEDGLVLAFNTWNDVLTPFVDPVSPDAAPDNIYKDGAGMEGDHNFVIMSYNDNEVIMRGERHSAEVRLVACDRSWEDYIAATAKAKSFFTNTLISSYYVLGETDTLYFTGLSSGKPTYAERITNAVRAKQVACCFTPQGFRLEHEDSIGSNKFHEFTLSPDSTCLQNEDGTVKVVACWDNFIVSHTSVWKMDASLFSAEQQSLFAQINAEIKKHNSAWELESMGLGKGTGGNAVNGLVLTFYTNATKTRTNTAGLGMNFAKTAYGQMSIDCDETNKVDNNMTSIKKKATDLETLSRQFAATLKGTYDMVPDNYFLPTGGTFTAVNGGTSFKLQ